MSSTIDTSGIDITKPVAGNATTASVRSNFAAIKTALNAAKTDITNLAVISNGTFVPGTITNITEIVSDSLTLTIPAETLYFDWKPVQFTGGNHTFTANCLAAVDCNPDGSYTYTEYANNDPEPAIAAGSIRRFYVYTGSSWASLVQSYTLYRFDKLASGNQAGLLNINAHGIQLTESDPDGTQYAAWGIESQSTGYIGINGDNGGLQALISEFVTDGYGYRRLVRSLDLLSVYSQNPDDLPAYFYTSHYGAQQFTLFKRGNAHVYALFVSETNITANTPILLNRGADQPFEQNTSFWHTLQITAADNGRHIQLNPLDDYPLPNYHIVTIDSYSTLDTNWFVVLENTSAVFPVTVAVTGDNTIDNLQSIVMYPGERRRIRRVSDNKKFKTIVEKTFYISTNVSGGFIIPSGYRQIDGLLWGGGGSGAKSGYSDRGAGGGGGGACVPIAWQIGFGEIIPGFNTGGYTIAASQPGRTDIGSGSVGNNSTFYHVTAGGGGGGYAATTSTAGQNYATGGGGGGFMLDHQTIAVNGLTPTTYNAGGAAGAPANSPFGGSDGGANTNATNNNTYGGGGGGGGSSSVYAVGGVTLFGGPGGGAVLHDGSCGRAGFSYNFYNPTIPYAGTTTSGGDAVSYGGGGCGTQTGTKAGNGASGHILLWGIPA